MKWALWILTAVVSVSALLGYDPVGQMLQSNKDCSLLAIIVLAIMAFLFGLAESDKKQSSLVAKNGVDQNQG